MYEYIQTNLSLTFRRFLFENAYPIAYLQHVVKTSKFSQNKIVVKTKCFMYLCVFSHSVVCCYKLHDGVCLRLCWSRRDSSSECNIRQSHYLKIKLAVIKNFWKRCLVLVSSWSQVLILPVLLMFLGWYDFRIVFQIFSFPVLCYVSLVFSIHFFILLRVALI